MNKKLTAVGLTAGLIAGAGAGLILEMSGSAGASNQSNAAAIPDGWSAAELSQVRVSRAPELR